MATTKLKLLRQDDGFDLPRLGEEDGTLFGWFDRINVGMDPTGKYATDFSDWEARDLSEMLTKDYKAQQIEKVLSLPLVSAQWTIRPAKGDTGEAAWLQNYWETDAFAGGCRTSLQTIISLMTSAFYFKRAYFEKVFRKGTGQFEGKIVYDDVAWRPQTTCRLLRDPRSGRFKGFEQEAFFLSPAIKSFDKWPIQVLANRSFVYTHGVRRDPVNGISDMEVAFWAWKTKQKVLMLWFQFLQSVSLPRIIVKAGDTTTATNVAREIARMKASGVLPLGVPGGPDSVGIESLDVSGKGSEQFSTAIDWLDTAATDSVLAGFLNLTGKVNMSHFGGSYALSKDASDFFLQSLEAKAREMEDQIRSGLFAQLIFHNFGPNAAVPRIQFEPLNDIDKEAALGLLKTAMAAPPGGPVPTSFISELAGQVATYLGLDGTSAQEDFKASFDAAAAQAQAQALAKDGGAGPGSTPTGQAVAGMAGAVQAAHAAIKAGVAPGKAHADAKKAAFGDQRAGAAAAKADTAKTALLQKHAAKVVHAKTGGDASLSNEDTDLAGFNPAEPRSGGRWTAGAAQDGSQAQQGAKKPGEGRQALLKERAALRAQAANLRAELAKLTAANQRGTHKGQATGKHAGPKGTTASAKSAPHTSAKASPSTKSSGAHAPANMTLPQQVAHLKKVVAHLTAEVVTAQQAARKK